MSKAELSFNPAYQTLTLHEAAHAWFNQDLFRERWIGEAWAEFYGVHAAAAVGELFLIHLNPLMDEAYYQQQQAAARETFSRTSVVPDLYWREL